MAEQNNTTNILMVGVGGQGIILASNIVSTAALHAGFDVKKSEIHGMSQRGGSVFSHIRFGKHIYSPVIPLHSADILLSLELMETLRWAEYAGPRTTCIVSRTQILSAMLEEYPQNLEADIRNLTGKVRFIEPADLIAGIGDRKFANVALCGVLSRYIDLPDNSWKQAIEAHVPEGTFEGNWSAFMTGKNI